MADLMHNGLSLDIRRSNDGERVEFGTTLFGKFFAFGSQRGDVFDRELAEAQSQQQAQQAPVTPQ